MAAVPGVGDAAVDDDADNRVEVHVRKLFIPSPTEGVSALCDQVGSQLVWCGDFSYGLQPSSELISRGACRLYRAELDESALCRMRSAPCATRARKV